jgi:hypothetical protein
MRNIAVLFDNLRVATRTLVSRSSGSSVTHAEAALLAIQEYPRMAFWLEACGVHSAMGNEMRTGPFQLEYKVQLDGKHAGQYTVTLR